MPPMNSTGMNTAASDTVIDRMVKPISREPWRAASIRLSPASMWRTMFSSITIASSTTKPTQSVSAISERLSMRVAEQVHDGEGADDRQRHREAGDQRGGHVAQEQEDHQHDQADGEEQRELHVVDRVADGHRAVVQRRRG